jgi:hypothetical protein
MTAWNRFALAAAVLTAAFATMATAAPFPAQHFALTPVGAEPLQNGFVEVIHPDGPQVYARHVYQLNGASSNESYEVVITIWTLSLDCSGDPTFVLPVAVLVTNGVGNGHAEAVHDPELLAALGLRGLEIGGTVTLLREGSPAYTTACEALQLD